MIVKTEKQIKEMCKFLMAEKLFAFDTETTSLKYYDLEIVGISFFAGKQGYYVPCGFDSECLETDTVIEFIRPLFERKSNTIIAHNMKYDMQVLHKYGIEIKSKIEDTMVMAHLLDEVRQKGLKILAQIILKKKDIKDYSDIVGKGMSIWDADLNALAKYAIRDAQWTYELFMKFKDEMLVEKVDRVYKKAEMPLIPVLVEMESEGIKIDLEYLKGMEQRVSLELDILRDVLYKEVGHTFNLNSTQQVGVVLFEEMGCPVIVKTATGKPSTAAWVLHELAHKGFDFVKKLLRYRELEKLLGTYIKAIPRHVDEDGRIRAHFNATGTMTGRLSSSNPNLQNQPTGGEFKLRGAFVADDGKKLIVADYSQVELRLIAHMSQDKTMKEMFFAGGDIHQQTANEMKIARKDAKAANFAYAYGAWGDYRDRYFDHFPDIRKWQKRQEKFLQKFGFVRTITGRKRRIGLPKGKEWKDISRMYRTAYNSSIQGSAADLMKMSMIDVAKILPKYGAKQLLTVHDELVIEVDAKNVKACAKEVNEAMVNCMKLDVPLVVDWCICNTWQEGK